MAKKTSLSRGTMGLVIHLNETLLFCPHFNGGWWHLDFPLFFYPSVWRFCDKVQNVGVPVSIAVFEFNIFKIQASRASKHSGFTCPKFNVLARIFKDYYFNSQQCPVFPLTFFLGGTCTPCSSVLGVHNKIWGCIFVKFVYFANKPQKYVSIVLFIMFLTTLF